MKYPDGTYEKLVETTQKILDAAKLGDLQTLGAAIDERGKCLKVLENAQPTVQQKAIAIKARNLDKIARAEVSKMRDTYRKQILNINLKSGGLIKYVNSRYNLSSGQLMDEKR